MEKNRKSNIYLRKVACHEGLLDATVHGQDNQKDLILAVEQMAERLQAQMDGELPVPGLLFVKFDWVKKGAYEQDGCNSTPGVDATQRIDLLGEFTDMSVMYNTCLLSTSTLLQRYSHKLNCGGVVCSH